MLRCQAYQIKSSTQKKHVLPLQTTTIEHTLIQGKFTISGKIILNLLKMHKYILTDATYLIMNYYEVIHYLQSNVLVGFGVSNGLVFYITYIYLTDYLLQATQKTNIKLHEDRHGAFFTTYQADRLTSRIHSGTFLYLLVYSKRLIPSPDNGLFSLLLARSVCDQFFDSIQSLQGDYENLPVNYLVLK